MSNIYTYSQSIVTLESNDTKKENLDDKNYETHTLYRHRHT